MKLSELKVGTRYEFKLRHRRGYEGTVAEVGVRFQHKTAGASRFATPQFRMNGVRLMKCTHFGRPAADQVVPSRWVLRTRAAALELKRQADAVEAEREARSTRLHLAANQLASLGIPAEVDEWHGHLEISHEHVAELVQLVCHGYES